MKTTISLKTLRTDPRQLVDLLNSGYEVSITEHRRELSRAKPAGRKKSAERGNARALVEYLKNRPPVKTSFPEMDTIELIKKTRLEGYKKKYQEILKQRDSS